MMARGSGGVPLVKDLPLLARSHPPTSLDYRCQNCTPTSNPRTVWSRQERRAYHRIKSGLEAHKGEILRFITLTSVENMKRPLNESFRVLKERIKRLTPLRLIKMGYIKKDDLRRYYPDKKPNDRLRFEYFKVTTTEGVNGVIHILYFGDYIPQKWLSDAWKEISGAYIVDIRACRNSVKSTKRLTSYIITQYVVKQPGIEKRFSWSWGWVCKGFVKIWRSILSECNFDIDKALVRWSQFLNLLRNGEVKAWIKTKQISFCDWPGV